MRKTSHPHSLKQVIKPDRTCAVPVRLFFSRILPHKGWLRKFIPFLLIAFILLITTTAQAAITTVASGVSPGWSNHRNRNVFYNGTRFFLLYGKGDGNLYYQSSTDNVTWSGESTLITEFGSLDFDIYLINDAKFDLVYRTSSNANRVRTCTISGATITAGSASTFATAWSNHELAVARSGGGDRIYVVGRFNAYLRIYSADQTGDAQNVTSWTNHLDQDRGAQNVAMVPYQGTDEVLVVYTRDAGGSTNDGVYSRVIAAGGGSGTEVECGDFDNLPDRLCRDLP